MELKDIELKKINGGAITSAFINAISKAVNTLFELGKSTGSSIRRLISGNYCPLR